MLHTAIVILNYNNYEDTINCIESVKKYNSAPIKYIVVDNGSSREGAVEQLTKYLSEKFAPNYVCLQEDSYVYKPLSKMTFLMSKTNDGYARGNNKGLCLAKEDVEIGWILILNNDILFVEDIIPVLINKLESLPHAGIVSPMLLKKDCKEIDYTCARTNVGNWEPILTYLCMYRDIFGWHTKAINSHYLLKLNPNLKEQPHVEIELPSGSCMLFKKEMMSTIKLFDPSTFLYYEENIIFKQEERLGLKNYLIPSLKCIHLGASSIKKSVHSFVLWEGVKSASYYLKNYGDMTLAQRLALPLARLAMKFKCFTIRKMRKRK